MENRFGKIAIIFIFIAVLFLGIITFFQQKAINQIKFQVSKIENALLEEKAGATVSSRPGAPYISVEEVESQKVFSGEIKSVGTDSLEIEAELLKLKNSESQKSNSKDFTINDFDKFKKMIKASLNDKTQYFGLKKEDLKVGDKIFVTADNSPYEANNLTVLKIAPLKSQ
jgi:hypothetical protein